MLRWLAVALLFFAPSAFASMTTTALTGRVVIGGAPGASVTVTATSIALQGSRTTTTDARGAYWLDALPPGTYDVTFSKVGHTTLTRRAVVELARIARADARLEPSEDEESVTSTISTLTVAETTAITSHVSNDALLRMPVESTPFGAMTLFARVPFAWTTIDGVSLPYVTDIGEEATEQVTIVYAAAGAEVDRTQGGLIAARTHTGSEEFTISLRDTISNDSGALHLFETATGGRIVPEKLWFFAAGWNGDDAWRGVNELRGFTVKLTAQPSASQNVEASILDSDSDRGFATGMTVSALRYSGVFGTRTTVQALASRASIPTTNAIGFDEDTLSLRATHVLGGHVLSAGATHWNYGTDKPRALFLNDRWSLGRMTFNAGVRREEGLFTDRTTPRASVAYDLHGNGRRAFFASYGEYGDGRGPNESRISSAGFATAIGTSGSARIDAIRRDDSFTSRDELRVAAQYRLFDRFEAGGTYSYGEISSGVVAVRPLKHAGTVWVSLELPIGDAEVGATILQHYGDDSVDRASPTDVALRYSVPFPRFRLTLASDVVNVLDVEGTTARRALRFWIRARL